MGVFLALAVAIGLHIVLRAWRSTWSQLRRPPGPRGLPIVGNFFDIPSERHWEGYHELANKYGDIVYLESFGQSIMVLSTVQRTKELLEKRARIYSDKPRSPMAFDLMNYGDFMGLMPYGTLWKRHRRAFTKHFAPADLSRYHPTTTKNVRKYLKNVANDPSKWMGHTKHLFSAIILEITYGVETTSLQDPLIRDMTEVIEGFSIGCLPGRWMVDTLPFLKYVPDWLPGAGFKKLAAYYRAVEERARNRPFDHVMKAVLDGTAPHSVSSSLIADFPDPGHPARTEEELIARNIAAVTHLAGADTTVGSALAFFVLIALHPEVQRKAQLELDEVVGFGRLPTYEDRASLVYINAILKESLRYHQVTPLALPHSTISDNVYEGYFIPKGTIVMGNAWHILHDPDIFKDPMAFRPERYIKDGKIDESVLDWSAAAFGFGRRICPGRHMAVETLYVVFASTLALFDIVAPKDENGGPSIKYGIADGGIVHPEPFEVILVPRSKDALGVLDI
ncbi:cytochrome P450 78A3p [Coprinopsis marcescibilis]|uniref:Cytochrome P450 78A3p n=1 Tax=Coprinopsis marcescibilis TaxID=230819 RepID=A0A5C3L4J3_COPMA|nr:cytochrome P450 78A3p [Coprinopsis marcescibilis]